LLAGYVPTGGVVFADLDGDGVRDLGEPGVAGAVVAFERSVFTTTRFDGSFDLQAPNAGLVWVRVPDGFRPGPVSRFTDGAAAVDLPLVPLTPREAASPLTFVVAADSHIRDPQAIDPWDPGDLGAAIDQATALAEPPRFFTIVGDITQGNTDGELGEVKNVLARSTVPWVPVAGNHDWYDGGANYRRYFGVDSYSFDIERVHFIVWDTNLSDADQIAFVEADLAFVDDDMTIVALGHGSPTDVVADAMDALGVDYLFTGHWHANRRVQRGAITEWGTQTFLMGGIDQSPSGYRIVTFAGGQPIVEHRARLVEPHLDVVSPHAGSCAPSTGFPVIVAAALDAARPEVTLRVDCGPEQTLTDAGGWTFRGQVPPLGIGTHSLALSARTPSGRSRDKLLAFEVCSTTGTSAPAFTSWPQLGGGPAHTGAHPITVTPPLAVQWTASVGGTLSLGTPIIGGGLAIVAITDMGAGDRGGLVALELATGVERWRYRTPFPAVAAPALAGNTVVVATKNGEVHAVSLANGAPRWRHDAAAGLPSFDAGLWAPPTIADGLVYVALQGNFTALDLATGEPVWAVDPADPMYTWLGSLAAVAVADGSAVAAFNRTLGILTRSAATGVEQWSVDDGRTTAVNASPVVGDGIVYLVNASGDVSAATLASGAIAWTRSTTPGGFEWGYSVTATPALADRRLFVATQWSDLVAFDAWLGTELWRVAGPAGPLNYAHYRSAEPGFPASPVVTGDLVWIGALDGTLTAYAAATGERVWSTQLGAPVVSAPAPTGDALVVATFDGSVRLLVPSLEATPAPVSACPPLPPPDKSMPPPPDPVGEPVGCRVGSSAGALLVGVIALIVRRRRRS
jgi:outer membrane protein assembly factor BamB